MKSLLFQYKSLIAYAFFGVCTTLVNLVAYYICNSLLSISNVPSVIYSWIVAIIFAYVVNKHWVFDCKESTLKIIAREFSSFVACRLMTGVIDVAVMYVAVDLCCLEPLLWKFIANVLVIILNYLAMKFLIFIK